MCGICGILDRDRPHRVAADLAAMSRLVSHRGPDDEGRVFFGPDGTWAQGDSAPDGGPWTAGLGHRRLSIIDLTPMGHQPMADSEGRYWIVLNGEIYNYVEIREELERSGYRFRSSSDTEVALAAYARWGADCLSRFNGMWAMAIYDRANRTLFCARDRFGVKPLLYACIPGRFSFSSEAKQLLALDWVPKRVNRGILADFFLWGYSNHRDETPFEGIWSLPPSHFMLVSPQDLDSGRYRPQRYWTPTAAAPLRPDIAEERFRDLFLDSVRIRLRSDVPVGVTLSGGLDSSSVASAAAHVMDAGGGGISIRGFSATFKDQGFSERPYAEAVAHKSKFPLMFITPDTAQLAADWNRFIWHMEEPFEGLSYFSSWCVYRSIGESGVPVILSGQGGDELLLGYERYRTMLALLQLRAKDWRGLLGEMAAAKQNAGMSYVRQAAYLLYFANLPLRSLRRRRLVGPYLRRGFLASSRDRTETLRDAMIYRDRREMQEKEVFRFQLPHLLHHEDRISMAHSIESRQPFLDYRLLELVLGQDLSSFFKGGWSKYILRRSMSNLLPESVVERRDKMGFDTPTGRLLQENGALFLPLLEVGADDDILEVSRVRRDFTKATMNENFLCSALSYLSWKNRFGLA